MTDLCLGGGIEVILGPPIPAGLLAVPLPGPPGRDGQAGNRYFLHTQTTPASEWTVVHGFGQRPQVSVVIDDEVIGVPVVHLDLNTVYIQFTQPQTGEVICS